MKRVVRVKLVTTEQVGTSLLRTLSLSNAAANIASARHFELGMGRAGGKALQASCYQDLKAMGLSAQPALLVLSKVKGAYATLMGNLKNGRYGKPGSKRHAKVTSKPVAFRQDAAQPYDDRCLSWQMEAQTVSIWSVDGRLKAVPFIGRAEDIVMLAQYRQGESDLVLHQDSWYLIATIDIPEPLDRVPREGFLGVDMGIVNIAYTSTQVCHSGAALTKLRKHRRAKREELQRVGTKSAKRKLKKWAGREARHGKNVNHQIAKEVVAEAQRTERGIALEELKGIRERVRLNKSQRATHGSWSFAQLREFITYKATAQGIPVMVVDAAYTSQGCHACGHTERGNRPNQETFACKGCGVTLHADHNAAMNIAHRGEVMYATRA